MECVGLGLDHKATKEIPKWVLRTERDIFLLCRRGGIMNKSKSSSHEGRYYMALSM